MICYLISNESFPGWVKIGFTTKSEMKQRLSVYQTGTPFRNYVVEHSVQFEDPKKAEKEVHDRLTAMRCERKGEWFNCSTKIACNIIDSVYTEIESGLLNNSWDSHE